MQQLLQAPTERDLQLLIEERASLVRSAANWSGKTRSSAERPKSKDQSVSILGASRGAVRSSAEFVAAIRGI